MCAAASGLADVLESMPSNTVAEAKDPLVDFCMDFIEKSPRLPGPYDLVSTLAEVGKWETSRSQ